MTLISGLDAHEESQAYHKINSYIVQFIKIYHSLLINSCTCKYQYKLQIDTYAICRTIRSGTCTCSYTIQFVMNNYFLLIRRRVQWFTPEWTENSRVDRKLQSGSKTLGQRRCIQGYALPPFKLEQMNNILITHLQNIFHKRVTIAILTENGHVRRNSPDYRTSVITHV